MAQDNEAKRETRKEKERATEKREIQPTTIEQIQGVGEATAEKLRKAGYNTITQIAQAQPDRLAEETGLRKYLAEKLISSAKEASKEPTPQEIPKEKERIAEETGTMKERLLREVMKDERFRRRLIRHIVDKLS